jgi:hypothetical protein
MANAGDWVNGKFVFELQYLYETTNENPVTISGNILTLSNGSWYDYGYVIGETIGYYYQLGGGVTASGSMVIVFINGNQMIVDDASAIPNGKYPDAAASPTHDYFNCLGSRIPEAAEFLFNLSPSTGNGSTLSVIDAEENRFTVTELNALPVGTAMAMNQVGNRSGGYVKNVYIKRLADPVGFSKRSFEVTYQFIQWGILRNDNDIPSYYSAGNCLKPYFKMKIISENSNPNSTATVTNAAVQAQVGFFDENYNGGANDFSVLSTEFIDYLGNTIEAIDYSHPTDVKITANAPLQSTSLSRFYFGIFHESQDEETYKNKPSDIRMNTMLAAPSSYYIHSLTPSFIGIFSGVMDNGAYFAVTNIMFTIVGSTIEFSFRITFNAAAQAMFENLPDGARRMRAWISLANPALAANLSNRVSLTVYDEDVIDAPTLGVDYPYSIDDAILDHALNETAGDTTTEDDVLYRANFLLEEGEVYDGIRSRIFAKNNITNEEFTLEDIFFNFASVPFVAGKYEANLSTPRTFNLPPTTDRKIISITRNPTIDSAGFYGIQLNYGYLNRWEYWKSQPNVSDDFFDASMDFLGLNKNWERFQTAEWELFIAYYVRQNDIDDYHILPISIRDYDDEPNILTNVTFTRPDGTQPTNLVADEVIKISVEFILTSTIYVPASIWVEFTVEDFEGDNRWVGSSILDFGNVAQNPLKPIAGQTKITTYLTAANVLLAECLIDTSLVNVNSLSLSYRVHSDVKIGKTTAPDDILKTTTDSDIKTLAE